MASCRHSALPQSLVIDMRTRDIASLRMRINAREEPVFTKGSFNECPFVKVEMKLAPVHFGFLAHS